MKHTDLIVHQLNLIAAHRRVLYTLESKEFKLVYDRLPEMEKAVIQGLAWRGNDKMIREYVFKNLETTLDDLSIRELRLVASRYHIPYYSIKPKKELIDAIRDKQNLGNSRRESGKSTPKTP